MTTYLKIFIVTYEVKKLDISYTNIIDEKIICYKLSNCHI